MTTGIVRQSLCARLREVAARLSAAPIETFESAQRYPGNRFAYQSGALEQICRNEAAVIDDLVKLLETVT
jgi:hypothetical protein